MDDSSISREQIELKGRIDGGSAIAGLASALIACLIVWLIAHSSFPILVWVFIAVAFPLVYGLASAIYKTVKTEQARCKSCGSEFSVDRSSRDESLLSAVARKSERQIGHVVSGRDEGKRIIVVEAWTEERYEVVDTFQCYACGDTKHVKSHTTREVGKTSDRSYRR